ncbi:hypothetical protein LX36DRAFT_314445 [Colletotrichum falcatum]|nr:hypothetical protein LX36DRAFT_314445 [Colletotrichum falcatum]
MYARAFHHTTYIMSPPPLAPKTGHSLFLSPYLNGDSRLRFCQLIFRPGPFWELHSCRTTTSVQRNKPTLNQHQVHGTSRTRIHPSLPVLELPREAQTTVNARAIVRSARKWLRIASQTSSPFVQRGTYGSCASQPRSDMMNLETQQRTNNNPAYLVALQAGRYYPNRPSCWESFPTPSLEGSFTARPPDAD